MDVQMMVFDLDGTLLDNNGKLQEYTVSILNKINIRKVIATSRRLNNCSEIGKEIAATDIVFSSGAGILYKNGTINYNLLKWKNVKQLINRLNDYDKNIRIIIKTIDDCFSNYYNDFSKNIDVSLFESDYIEKITIKSDLLDDMKDMVAEGNKLNIDYVNIKTLIITSKEAGKKNAILSLCQKYNIKKEQVLIFGDGDSDIDSFKIFKNSVSVLNSTNSLMKLASDICLSSEDEGVAKWLNVNYLKNYVEPIVKKGSASDLIIDKKKKIVTKLIDIDNEGINNGYTKLFYEIKHMSYFNNKGYNFFPKIYSISESNKSLICQMEYLYDGVSFSDLLNCETIGLDYIKNSIEFILKELYRDFYFVKENVTPNPNYIIDNYIKRVRERLEITMSICHKKRYKILPQVIKHNLVLNGVYYPSYLEYIDFIVNDENIMKMLQITMNTNSHHDLTPSNIIVDYSKDVNSINNFKLIDPRGELETGVSNRHFMYDMGKILFGLNGFDLIRIMFDENDKRIGKYDCKKGDGLYNFNFKFNQDYPVVVKYKLAYDTIFSYFNENKYNCFPSIETIKNYETMFLFAETCNFVADIPCRLNNNDREEIGICFYLRAIETISKLITKIYGKDIVKEKLKCL